MATDSLHFSQVKQKLDNIEWFNSNTNILGFYGGQVDVKGELAHDAYIWYSFSVIFSDSCWWIRLHGSSIDNIKHKGIHLVTSNLQLSPNTIVELIVEKAFSLRNPTGE